MAGRAVAFALPLLFVAPAAHYKILNIVNGSFLHVGNLLLLTLLGVQLYSGHMLGPLERIRFFAE